MSGATDGVRAHDILLSYEPLSRHGACWYYVWQAYAAAGAWTNMGSSPTAYDGWHLSNGKHPGDMNPPHGAAIWLGRRYDGNMDGDVFIAGAWDGDHAATDQPVYGQTGTTSIQARMNLCGREYLGWTDHVLDCPITSAQPPEPEPIKRRVRNDIMIHGVWRDDNGTIAIQFAPRGRITQIGDPNYWAGISAATGAVAAQVSNQYLQDLMALYGTLPYAAVDMEHTNGLVLIRDNGDGKMYLFAGGTLIPIVDESTIPNLEGRVPQLALAHAEIENMLSALADDKPTRGNHGRDRDDAGA